MSDVFNFLIQDTCLPHEQRQNPDYPEKRLAMAMVRSVVDDIDRWAQGRRLKPALVEDTLGWIKGETDSMVTLETVCTLLHWDVSMVRQGLLDRIERRVILPKLKIIRRTKKGRPRGLSYSSRRPWRDLERAKAVAESLAE